MHILGLPVRKVDIARQPLYNFHTKMSQVDHFVSTLLGLCIEGEEAKVEGKTGGSTASELYCGSGLSSTAAIQFVEKKMLCFPKCSGVSWHLSSDMKSPGTQKRGTRPPADNFL